MTNIPTTRFHSIPPTDTVPDDQVSVVPQAAIPEPAGKVLESTHLDTPTTQGMSQETREFLPQEAPRIPPATTLDKTPEFPANSDTATVRSLDSINSATSSTKPMTAQAKRRAAHAKRMQLAFG